MAGPAILLSSASAALTTTVTNPHDSTRPDYCLDCHTEEIYGSNCDEPEGFCLLADSVDGLCLLCHVQEDCCRAGQEHQAKLFLGKITHPSGIDSRDVSPKHRPRELPTHDGKITCRTCHLHTRLQPENYKMLRIVRIEGDKVDWSVLCQDCHDENF